MTDPNFSFLHITDLTRVGFLNVLSHGRCDFGGMEMPDRKRILIVDDDVEICEFVEEILAFRFQILKAHDATSGLKLIREKQPHLVILDLRLKNENGLDLCRILRQSPATKHIPILIYSGSDDLEHLTQAFDLGADDYVVKTARPRELVARILSKIRRLEEREEEPEQLTCGNLVLDNRKLEASIDGQTLPLSVLEFNLIQFFVKNKDRVMSRQQILEGVWKDAIVSNRTIDTHMVYLRKKLSGFSHSLSTVYGAGYILRNSPQPECQPLPKPVEESSEDQAPAIRTKP